MTLTEFEMLTVEKFVFTESLGLKGLVKMDVETKDGSKYGFYIPEVLFKQLRNPEPPTSFTINEDRVSA